MINALYKDTKKDIEIHIFKTNVRTKLDLDMLQLLFSLNKNIIEWSVDLEDVDKVLRVDTINNLSEKAIASQIKLLGFNCEPLD